MDVASDRIKTRCIECGHVLRLEPTALEYTCPNCKAGFFFRLCSDCGRIGQAPTDLPRGAKVQCPHCQAVDKMPLFGRPSGRVTIAQYVADEARLRRVQQGVLAAPGDVQAPEPEHAAMTSSDSDVIALPCPQCGRWSGAPAMARQRRCTYCGTAALFARCASCMAAAQVKGNGSWNCPWCKVVNRSPKRMPQLSAAAIDIQEELVRRGLYTRDASKNVLTDFKLLSVQGHDVPPGSMCTVTLLSDGIVVAPLDHTRQPKFFRSSDIVSLEVGGPGVVRTGGGYRGGGFGVVGMVEGMALATALNAITTKTSITNVLQLVTRTCAYVAVNTTYSPSSLKLAFTPLQQRLMQIEAERRSPPQPLTDQAASPSPPVLHDRYERLAKLGRLRESGVLTEEEFQAEKARILAES